MSVSPSTGSFEQTIVHTAPVKIFDGACRRIRVAVAGDSANAAQITVKGMHKGTGVATLEPGDVEYFEAGNINNDITEVHAQGVTGSATVSWYVVAM